MSITATLNTAQPTQSVNFPFLGTSLHTDKQTIVFWLVLADGSGVVIDKTGRKIPPTPPATPPTPPATPPTPASGVITLSDATTQTVTDGQQITLPFGINITTFTGMTSWTMDVTYNGVTFSGISAATSTLTPTNTGTMTATFHAPPPTTPAATYCTPNATTYYTPNAAAFPIGYQEPNVMSRYSIIPYIGSVTLTTTTTAI